MAARFILVLCASALLVQLIAGNPCGCGRWSGWEAAGALAGAEIASLGYAAPTYAPTNIYTGPAYAAKSGGAFGVAVASPNSATGVSVLSENSIDGALEVSGSLPVLAGVAFDGTVPSAGVAGTAYSCGCGEVGIATESLAANNIGIDRAALNAGYAGTRLGCSPRLALPRSACGCY